MLICESCSEDQVLRDTHNAKVLDIITSASMYRVAQERREVSQGTRETAGLVNTLEPAKNP